MITQCSEFRAPASSAGARLTDKRLEQLGCNIKPVIKHRACVGVSDIRPSSLVRVNTCGNTIGNTLNAPLLPGAASQLVQLLYLVQKAMWSADVVPSHL